MQSNLNKLFFIYVAKNEEWKKRQEEDWDYVSSMVRLFDRMSLAYLSRDHQGRGKSVYHFYLSFFKPFWTDCNVSGYATNNFGMVQWKRPEHIESKEQISKFFADYNCARVSHVLLHEILRLKGKSKK